MTFSTDVFPTDDVQRFSTRYFLCRQVVQLLVIHKDYLLFLTIAYEQPAILAAPYRPPEPLL